MVQRTVAVLLLSLSLIACSPLDVIKTIAPSTGPEVTAQVGKENEKNLIKTEVNTQREDNTDIAADEVQIVNERIPPWLIVVTILGWLAPSATEMFGWFKKRKH